MKQIFKRVLYASLAIYILYNSGCTQSAVQNPAPGILIPHLAPSAYVGDLSGNFSVGDFGNPEYDIPIEVPPGINSVQPNISLTYSAIKSDGILGVGWNLTGLSVITRVGKIIPQDSIKGGVFLNSNDRFAINGQRLIAYRDSSGKLLKTLAEKNSAYGQNGTEYRTEIESWMRVFSYGNCGNGPCFFTAYAKDGSVIEFAHTLDSRIQPSISPVVYCWAANKVTDRNGNYVLIHYNQNPQDGSYVPTQLLYTGNERAKLLPQRLIEFITEDKNDRERNYIAGIPINCSFRIKNVNTYVDLDGDGASINIKANLVRQYTLAYDYNKTSGKSLLDSVFVSDANGFAMPATHFDWSAADLSAFFSDTLSELPEGFRKVLSNDALKIKADFNGDSRLDIALLEHNATTIPIVFSNSDNSFSVAESPVPPGFASLFNDRNVQTVAGDFNGDGLSDIAFFQNKSGTVPILFSAGHGKLTGAFLPLAPGFNTLLNDISVVKYAGDFNGDGITDIAGLKQGYTSIPLLLGTPSIGFQCIQSTIPSTVSAYINAPNTSHDLADFNGDGLTDIACFNTVSRYKSVPMLFSTGINGGFTATLSPLPANVSSLMNATGSQLISGDFNGDGLTDVAVFNKGYTKIPLIYSKGNGDFEGELMSLSAPAVAAFNNGSAQIVSGDLNGDGKTDFAAFNLNSNYLPVLFSYADSGFIYNQSVLPSAIAKSINGPFVEKFITDFNGDGLLDIAGIKKGYTALPVLVSNHFNCENNLPGLLTRITNGIGAVIHINYTPSSVYDSAAIDTTLKYPLMGVRFPQYTVSSFASQNSADNPSTIIRQSYRYESPVIDHYRGFLGYKKSITTNPQNQTVVITSSLAKFPYQGIVVRKQVFDRFDFTKCLGNIWYDYASDQDSIGGVYRIWNNRYLLDHFTNGHYNFTKAKEFIFDQDHKLITHINDIGDTSDSKDNVYTDYVYPVIDLNNIHWWQAFYPLQEKAYASPVAKNNPATWMPGDYYWTKFVYDSSMNKISTLNYVNNFGDGMDSGWICNSSRYDVFGNATAEIAPPNYSKDSIISYTIYDSLFHTFPVTVISPSTLPGSSQSVILKMQYGYDPRFGLLVHGKDANGNIQANIPDMGVDGFGRILITQSTKPFSNDLINASITSYQRNVGSGYSITSKNPVSWSNAETADSTWLSETSVFDGMEREVQNISNGYNANTSLVSLNSYNLKGQLVRSYMPFFTGKANSLQYKYGSASTTDSLYIKQEYDDNGLLKFVWSPPLQSGDSSFISKEITYDSLDNRVVYVKTPSPANDRQFIVTRKEYDAEGKLRKKSGPFNTDGTRAANFGEVTYEYDAMNRLVKSVDPLNEVLLYKYNSVNQLIWQWRPETDTIKYGYNKNDWMVRQQDANGALKWFYDDMGRVIKKLVISAENNVSDSAVYLYDNDVVSVNSKGLLSRVTVPGFQYTYHYDKTGMVYQTETWSDSLAKNIVQRFAFDPVQRASQVIYPDSSIVSYSYTHDNNLAYVFLNNDTLASYSNYTSLGDYSLLKFGNKVSTGFTYDNVGRLLSSNTQKAAFQQEHFRYKWNRANKLITIDDLKDTGIAKLDQQFSYFPTGRLDSVSGPYGKQNYTYDAAGNRLSVGEISYKYDSFKKHELSSITKKGATLADFGFDKLGNLSRKNITANFIQAQALLNQNKINPAIPSSMAYSFDTDGKLNSVRKTVNGFSSVTDTFSYDDEGERVVKRDSNNTSTYYISSDFEIVKLPSGALVATKYVNDGDYNIYAESSNGGALKLISKTSLNGFGDSLTGYNLPIGKYIARQFIQPSIIVLLLIALLFFSIYRSVNYYRKYRGQHLSPRYRKMGYEEKHMAFIFPSSAPLLRIWKYSFVFFLACLLLAEPAFSNMPPGPNGPGVPFAGQKRFFHQNQVGSIILITDENGGITNSIVYQPFGTIDENSSTGQNDFRPKFTGKEKDENTGLNYFGSRYYDSDLGRFISPDAMNQYHSPYSYGDSDPLSGSDPDGNEFVFVIALIVAAIVGAYVGASLANGTFNPADWEWGSAKTWIGVITGAAAGVAVVATGGAALASFGIVAAESVALGSISASTIAFSMDAVMLAVDTYSFAQQPDLGNGIFVALDLIPFAGALLGRTGKAANMARKGIAEAVDDVGDVARAEDNVVDAASIEACVLSFARDTKVYTASGIKTIQDIQVGDEVKGYDEKTKKEGVYPVARIFKRIAASLLLITISGDSIAVTPEHPFYIENRGWVDAGALKPGDRLFKTGGTSTAVLSVKSETKETEVFNFEVEGAHDYFVSSEGVLVHNGKCKSKREIRMGKTPGKWSKTGRGVLERWTKKGKAKYNGGKWYVNVRKTNGGPRVWVPLDKNIHMGHKLSAAEAWTHGPASYIALKPTIYKPRFAKLNFNFKGQLSVFGNKAKPVRQFMLFSENYRFEWGPLNSSNGSGGIHYYP